MRKDILCAAGLVVGGFFLGVATASIAVKRRGGRR